MDVRPPGGGEKRDTLSNGGKIPQQTEKLLRSVPLGLEISTELAIALTAIYFGYTISGAAYLLQIPARCTMHPDARKDEE